MCRKMKRITSKISLDYETLEAYCYRTTTENMMKTELTNNGTYIATGNYGGHKFIAAGHSRPEAMAEGYAAIDVIMERMIVESLPWCFKKQAE